MLEKCSVIGLGKLGLPLAAILAEQFPTIGVDLNPALVEQVNQRRSPIPEPGLQEMLRVSTLQATTNIEHAVGLSDITFIIVPTPSEADGKFTNKYVLDAIEKVGAAIAKKSTYHLVSITSTVMPGSTRGIIKETLEKHSKRLLGENLGLTYNPEFIALGDVISGIKKPDMVLIGEPHLQSKEGDLLEQLYKRVCIGNHKIARAEYENAEMAKITLNTFLTVKISFANTVGEMCDALPHGDAAEVMRIVGYDSRISPKFLMPSTSFGGPCLPRDGIAFGALFKSLLGDKGANSITMFEAVNNVNNQHLNWLLGKITSSVKQGSRVGILGLSYKPGTEVLDVSTGVALAIRLASKGFIVSAFDPLVKKVSDPEFLQSGIKIQPDLRTCVLNSDILVISTACKEFKILEAMQNSEQHFPQVVLDCWRMFKAGQLGDVKIMHVGENDRQATATKRARLSM